MRLNFILLFPVTLFCLLFTIEMADAKISTEEFFKLCEKGTVREVEDAINAGADVNVRNGSGDTPIMLAAECNSNSEVTTALINAGADINAMNERGWMPIMVAALSNSNPAVTTALINAGADVNATRINGETPLLLATVINSNPEVMIALIKAGADVNACESTGLTPLTSAAKQNPNPEFVTTLLKLGANPSLKDKFGKMAIDYAKENEKIKNSPAIRKLEDASYCSIKNSALPNL